MSTTREGSGATGNEAKHALHHHNRLEVLSTRSISNTGVLIIEKNLHTKYAITQEKTTHWHYQQNQNHKQMVGEHTSKRTVPFLLEDIHLSTSNAILFRKLHYWQDMTKALMAQQGALPSQTTFNCREKGIGGPPNHYQVFIMGVLFKRGGLVQT